MSRSSARAGAGGFTLLEVLVAFVIAALAIGALVAGVGGGLRSTRVAGHTEEALSRARSRLAALAATPLRPGEASGDDGGGYRWRTRTQPTAVSGQRRGEETRARPVTLYTLTVAIGWSMDGGAREVVLATQQIGAAPPEADGP